MEWLMLAQAGVAIGGSIYNMIAGDINTRIQDQRIQQEKQRQLDALRQQELRLGARATAQDQAMLSQAEQAMSADVAAGRVDVGATEFRVAEAMRQQNLQSSYAFQDIGTARSNLYSQANQQTEDLYAQNSANQINSMLNIAGTAIGTAAGIYDYQSRLTPDPVTGSRGWMYDLFNPSTKDGGGGAVGGGGFFNPQSPQGFKLPSTPPIRTTENTSPLLGRVGTRTSLSAYPDIPTMPVNPFQKKMDTVFGGLNLSDLTGPFGGIR